MLPRIRRPFVTLATLLVGAALAAACSDDRSSDAPSRDTAATTTSPGSGASTDVGAGAGTGAASLDEPEVPRPPVNVVLFVVDTLRADRLGAWGAARPTSPSVDALAARGTRFERVSSVATWTMPTVATLLTGLYPATHGVTSMDRAMPPEAETLAEVFANNGYQTAGIVSHTLIGTRFGYQQGFDIFDDSEAGGHEHVSTPGVASKAEEVLADLATGEGPFFAWFHLFDPHFEYRGHDGIDFAGHPIGRLDGTQKLSDLRVMQSDITAKEREYLLALYDEEIRFTDVGIGRVVAALEDLGVADHTVIVFTADHGEEFGEHGWIGHLKSPFQQTLSIPLVIVDPRIEDPKAEVARPVSQAAVAATILDLADLEWSDELPRGRSLAPLLVGETVDSVAPLVFDVDYLGIGGQSDQVSVQLDGLSDGSFKLIRDARNGTTRLFDLFAPRSESRNVASDRPDVVESLGGRLDQILWIQSNAKLPEARPSSEGLDPKMLEALGYSSGGTSDEDQE